MAELKIGYYCLVPSTKQVRLLMQPMAASAWAENWFATRKECRTRITTTRFNAMQKELNAKSPG